ncbi:MAG: hypothetical protein E4G94_12340 [ANME-2 cluster archaeon]|nr:MAG: hypothetical protein E4G94_12340 [ANME-2 cluster archaeon]
MKAKKKELRHDRHTVSLLADHMVITPKYRRKILFCDVALITEAYIPKTYHTWLNDAVPRHIAPKF